TMPETLADILAAPSTEDIRRAYIDRNPRLSLFDRYGLPPETDKPPRDSRPFPGLSDALMAPINALSERLPPGARDMLAAFAGPRMMPGRQVWHGTTTPPDKFGPFDLSKVAAHEDPRVMWFSEHRPYSADYAYQNGKGEKGSEGFVMGAKMQAPSEAFL